MKMDFVLANSSERALCGALSELLKKAENNKEEKFIVLAPETKTLFVERYLLDRSANHAFCNIYVYSFARLLKKLQIRPVFPLSKEAGVMIVRNLVMELGDDLVCYKKTASTVGFAENIFETIQQLKSSSISASELSEAAKQCPMALRIKLEDISLLYDAYERYLGEDLIDPSDKLTMLDKEVAISERIKESNVYVVGFDSLTSSMANVVKSIAKNAKSLTVSAPFMHPESKNAHICDNEVYEKFKSIAESLHIKYQPRVMANDLEGDFLHIYKNLFTYPAAKAKRQGQVRLYGFSDPIVEAKKVASEIKSAVAEGKYRYRDVCIYLASDLKAVVEHELDNFELPYFSASPYQFESHPLFGFIRVLFQMLRRNLDASDVFCMARNSLLNLAPDAVDDFENYCLKYGISHNRFLKAFTIEDDARAGAEKVRKSVMSVFAAFSSVYGENMPICDLVDAIFAFFERFNLDKRLERLENLQKERGDVRAAMATVQAYEKAREVLGMLKQFLGTRVVKLEDLYILLISGLEAADISLLPLGIDTIQVVTSADGLYDIKSLYVVGAVDGAFPKREQDLGLIQDAEILRLEGISEKKIEPTIRTINRRERYKVFELLTLPKRELSISFAERGEKGDEEKMSSLMLMLADLFLNEDGSQYEIERLETPFVLNMGAKALARSLGSKKVATAFLAESVAAFGEGVELPAGKADTDELYVALKPDFSAEESELFSLVNSKREPEMLEEAQSLFFKGGKTSISELESYFACPFKHFVDYGLRLSERKEASMKALDVGDILHAVAEKFVLHYMSKKGFDTDRLAVNLLERVLREKKYSEEDNLALVKILKDESKRLCRGIGDQLDHSLFRPFGVEKWFGGEDLAGIGVHTDPDIQIVGKIDRLDQTDKHYRIIDYKTGKVDTSAEDIYYGHKLQLAIYLSAMQELKKDPAGVLYFPVHNEYQDSEEDSLDAYKMQGFMLADVDVARQMDTTLSFEHPKSHYIGAELKVASDLVASGEYALKQKNNLLSAAELENMRLYALAVAKQAVKEILAGYINIAPFKKNNKLPCDWCNYKNVCGIVSSGYKSVRAPSLEGAKDFFKGGAKWEE